VRQEHPGGAGPTAPAVGRALDRAIDGRTCGLISLNAKATTMGRHCATRRLRRIAESAGVRMPWMQPDATPSLRHHDLLSGVHLKVMPERLGHSSISVTGDFYSHVAPALQRDAAQQIADQALGSWTPSSFPCCSQDGPEDDSAACSEDRKQTADLRRCLHARRDSNPQPSDP